MLTNIRKKHAKRILWGLVIVIVPAFVLWGGLKGSGEKPFGEIAGKKITASDFNDYLRMAYIHFLLASISDRDLRVTPSQRNAKAWEFLLFLWKAKQDKIIVTDQEVMDYIQKMFSINGRFDKEFYLRFLQYKLNMPPRAFEEYIRNFIKIDKLTSKYIETSVSEDELKNAYKKDTQQAKIDYILIPYDEFKEQITIIPTEVEDFYSKNKNLFREKPRVKIQYVIIEKDTPSLEEVLEAANKIKRLDDLKSKFSLEIKETAFIGLKDPIEGIGWQPIINQMGFAIKKDKISSPFETEIGYVVIKKLDEKESFIPALKDIQGAVEEKLILEKMKKLAKDKAANLLEKIKSEKIKTLQELAKHENLDFKKIDYFKYYDYIEGVGLDEKISTIIFSLKDGEINPTPLFLERGAYIVQMKHKTPLNEKDFESKRQDYYQKLLIGKLFSEKLDFISDLEREARLKIYYTAQ